MRTYPFRVALDFDGVCHAYTSPWKDYLTIVDGPVGPHMSAIDGTPAHDAIAWINAMLEQDNVEIIISTCRLNAGPIGQERPGPEWAQVEVRDVLLGWFGKHGVKEPWKLKFAISVKPHADVYIDDRGYRFEGKFPTLDELKKLVPWNKQKQSPLFEEPKPLSAHAQGVIDALQWALEQERAKTPTTSEATVRLAAKIQSVRNRGRL